MVPGEKVVDIGVFIHSTTKKLSLHNFRFVDREGQPFSRRLISKYRTNLNFNYEYDSDLMRSYLLNNNRNKLNNPQSIFHSD